MTSRVQLETDIITLSPDALVVLDSVAACGDGVISVNAAGASELLERGLVDYTQISDRGRRAAELLSTPARGDKLRLTSVVSDDMIAAVQVALVFHGKKPWPRLE